MQISSVNNYQNSTNFTGFRVNPQSMEQVMERFDTLSTKKLLKATQIIREEAKNPVNIAVTDISEEMWHKTPYSWNATINGKIYDNLNPNTPSAYNFMYFLRRLSNKAQKLNPNKPSSLETKIQKYRNKIEQLQLKQRLANGESEEKIRDNYLDQIFELIRIK
jgi:hypothetical protein